MKMIFDKFMKIFSNQNIDIHWTFSLIYQSRQVHQTFTPICETQYGPSPAKNQNRHVCRCRITCGFSPHSITLQYEIADKRCIYQIFMILKSKVKHFTIFFVPFFKRTSLFFSLFRNNSRNVQRFFSFNRSKYKWF